MSHSLIIQLSTARLKKNEFLSIFDLTEDPVLRDRSDWAGAEGEFGACAEQIATELRPVCFVNRGRQTIRFKSDGTLRRRVVHTLHSLRREVSASLSGERIGTNETRIYGAIVGAFDRLYDVSRILLYYETDGVACCHTLAQAALDRLNGRLPQVMYVGGVLDYHY